MFDSGNTLAIMRHNVEYILPQNIIVIGSACVGKSTLITNIIKEFPFYTSIDDLYPLMEIFALDEYIKENLTKSTYDRPILNYSEEIFEEYKKYDNEIPFYSKKAEDGIGYDIIRPELWDKILSMAISKHGKYNIIEFARGRDRKYDAMYQENPYDRGLRIIINKIGVSSIVIVYIKSDYELQLKRNYYRYMSGGHAVSKEEMIKVYSFDPFEYDKFGDNIGVKRIDGYSIPVFKIENNHFSERKEENRFYQEKIDMIFSKLYPSFINNQNV